jgi:hypothetical protein
MSKARPCSATDRQGDVTDLTSHKKHTCEVLSMFFGTNDFTRVRNMRYS